ncbi:hypothetical protein LAZ67_5001398 [Cordylochernes scorpioides]|uniref:Retrovirus-related Pol polyprotein from transposon TNT 1-94 n=1 Tax=Cordylochernes scorpioides TaxID=51811 RepID=A0ABY6KFU5_9ARAC|nr:hypothetical protein LAZ67_5001398 [Cordylochernes scorpioides]
MSGHRKRRQFKQTDAFTRGMVIGLKRAGWSIHQIAADTHLGASTVHRLWRRWLEQGNVAIYRNAGATRVTSARVDRRILRQAVAAPQATCTAILQHVQDTLDHSISTRTISRRLVANGLHSCRPLRRLPLTPPNRRQRLEWCRARSTWMTEWHRVVFSDESRFCLSSDSRLVRAWRRRGERSNPAAIVERPTVRQRGIMVWGAIAYDSRSPLLRIQGTMTAQRYVDDVLRPVTLPYLQGVPNALYQQDNARPHTACISQQALQDHVWDIIGRRLHALPQPRSEDELWQMVEREWRAIPQDAIRTLIDSLPRRVAACIAVREDKDMQQHITTMMELVDKLRTIGETLKDSHITAILLCSLPKSYSNLITMLESRPDDELTLEFTKNKLLDEHTRRVESSKDESTASKALKSLHGASSQRREKEKKFCSFCHKPNHSKEECWHYQKRNNSNKEYKYENFRRGNVPKYTNQSSVTQEQSTNQRTTKGPNPKALNCTQREASVHNWFVDSGATSHMAYDESFFTELNREQTQNVVVANGNKLQVKGIGQGEIKVITPQGKTDTLLLTKVLYIPELTDNLLSVSAATSNGCKVTFNRDWCTIERDNTALANGILDNGMYRLHLDDNPQTRTFKANVAKQNHCKNKNCLMLWHDRLGHRNIESIKKIRNENLARGLSLNNCSHSTDCVQCIQGKLTETPFPKKTEYRATETLQLVHSDICGPLPTNSLSGKRYFITFTDDYSRYTKIYLLKGKDEAYEKIKDYVISAHTEFGKNIQTIRTDNGREYVNRQVEDFLNQSGIKHQLTVPYSPAQNGVAESKNRSLMEMTRCMLFDSGLPQSLWAEAVTTANYLHNRIPSKATDKTPFELWTNRKPSLKHLKRFGCKAFAYIPKIKRNKLDSKVIEGIFLGYDDRSKGYRILHDTDNITISRSVKFLEKENGFHLASTKTTSPQVLSTDLSSSYHIGNAEESQEHNPKTLKTQKPRITFNPVQAQEHKNDYMLYKTEAQDIPTPTSYSEVLQLPKIEREKWLQAMNEELNSLEKNNVWELTPLPKDKKIIGCKWTYIQKLNSKGEIERYKARLVAKGFNQKFGRDYEETFAPIVKHSTIRAFLAASVYKGMQVIHLDVKTAFLHGDLDKELYMELPEGLHTKQTNKVCKLKKAIYGLKQAGRSWNTKIASTLIKNNFKQSIVDPCLFTKNEENHSIYLILYVDDMLLASDSEIIIQNTVKTLEKEFEIKNLGDPTQFIGIEISRNREGELLLSQKNKIQELVERYNLQEAKPTFTPMESGYPGISDEKLLPNNVQYQQLIGSLLYLSVVSRPDIAAPVCILSSRNQNPRNCDWNAAKRIVRYLKTTKELELRISNQKPPTLEAYSDATWASDNTDRKSLSGNLFLLGSNPISWMTGKQGCVSLSSTEAELISAAEASQELLWLLDLLKDLELEQKAPIYFHQDNQSCLKICSSEKVSSRTKHIATKTHHLKDLQKKTVIKMIYCPTGDMKADILTKPLPRPTFEKLRYNLVIVITLDILQQSRQDKEMEFNQDPIGVKTDNPTKERGKKLATSEATKHTLATIILQLTAALQGARSTQLQTTFRSATPGAAHTPHRPKGEMSAAADARATTPGKCHRDRTPTTEESSTAMPYPYPALESNPHKPGQCKRSRNDIPVPDFTSTSRTVQAVPKSPVPTVNAYKEFIPDHARLRTPLVNLLKKNVMWVWSDECQKAFTNLKESLTTHPTLHLYQEGLPCQVYCNTSTLGIAGILKQVYPDGKTYPVQHFSRSLRGHERNYSDLELQCLAIVESVDNFRACLMGRKFTILSDHPALQWLKEIKAPSGRLFRWRLRLSRYEYEVRSINGVQQYETGVVTRIPFCGFLDAPLIKSRQSSPPGKPRVTMDHNELRTVSRKGVLKTIVPSSLTARLLKSVHTQHHHPNISKMTRLISSQYYWQNMTQDIAKQVKTCPTCRFARRIDESDQPSRKNTDTGPKTKQNSYIKHSVHTTQTMPKLHHPRQRNDHTSQLKSITADILLIKPLTIKQENCEPTNHLNSTINKDQFSKLKDIDCKLKDLDQKMVNHMMLADVEEDALNCEIEEAEHYSDTFITLERRVREVIESDNKMDVKSLGSTNGSSMAKGYRLPKFELRTFDGELINWLPFWAQFEKIHEDNELHDADKFHYLVQSMQSSTRARELIESYPQTAENYAKAVQALKQRYGQKDLLVEIYIRELLILMMANVRTPPDERRSVAKLYDKLETQLRSLESLGVDTKENTAWLFPMIESCLPEDVLVAWQRSPLNSCDASRDSNSNSSSRLNNLLDFLRREVEGEERRLLARKGFEGFSPKEKLRNKFKQNSNVPTAAGLFSAKEMGCLFCEKNHQSKDCITAQSMPFKDKRAKIYEKRCCLKCLKPGHLAKACKRTVQCNICTKGHYVLLCPDLPCNRKENTHVSEVVQSALANQQCTRDVTLMTLMVNIMGNNGYRRVRALLDPGSQKSYILESTALEVKLKPVGNVNIAHSLFGGTQTETKCHKVYKVALCSNLSELDNLREFEFLGQDIICGEIPRTPKGAWLNYLKGSRIWLSDLGRDSPKIELLIGSDIYGSLLSGRVKQLENGLTAIETHLGWTICGPSPKKDEQSDCSSLVVISMHSRNISVDYLWDLETIGIKDPRENLTKLEEDKIVHQHFLNTVHQLEDGRFCVGLPWLGNQEGIPSNRHIAERRLFNTTRKLRAKCIFSEYDRVFQEWLAEGVIEKVSPEDLNGKCHYLPHHPVVKANSNTTKIRPVFDASCKDKGNLSLNDCLASGPNVIEQIPAILLKFRANAIGVIADIRKAFLQIEVKEEDRDYLRFLWWRNNHQIQVFRHKRVVFGVTCSPYLLGAVILHHLKGVSSEFGALPQKLMECLYIDNCVTSVDTEAELVDLVEKSTEIFAKAKMDLRMWQFGPIHRIKEVYSRLPPSVDIERSEEASVLGMKWNLLEDTLNVTPKFGVIKNSLSKRDLLSHTQQIFDPIGFLAPVLLPAKLLIQQTWTVKTDWDEPLPSNIQENFMKWYSELDTLADIKIPRRVGHGIRAHWSIHIFCDASQSAYAAAAFLRCPENKGVSVQLLMAKSRLGPLKKTTIPRMELLACMLGVRLSRYITESLNLAAEPVYYWTDSTTALSWIKTNRQWGTFVNNRVKEICNTSGPNKWFYVPGSLNPADLPSRGCIVLQLKRTRWWEGPEWLKQPQDHWPKQLFHSDRTLVNLIKMEISPGASKTKGNDKPREKKLATSGKKLTTNEATRHTLATVILELTAALQGARSTQGETEFRSATPGATDARAADFPFNCADSANGPDPAQQIFQASHPKPKTPQWRPFETEVGNPPNDTIKLTLDLYLTQDLPCTFLIEPDAGSNILPYHLYNRLKAQLPNLSIKNPSLDLSTLNSFTKIIGHLTLPLTIGQITRRENFHVVNASLPFGVLTLKTLYQYKLKLNYNHGTIFQLGVPLSNTIYHFKHVSNECKHGLGQNLSQRTRTAPKAFTHGNPCLHSLPKPQIFTCHHSNLTPRNFSLNPIANTLCPQHIKPQDGFHTHNTRTHTSSHNGNTHNQPNKRDTHTKRRHQPVNTCTIVKNNTIIPSTQNIEKIHATKQPHNRKTLRSFLKAVNAYKEFIPDHARLRTPLVNLLKKDVMWVWDDERQKAFTNLKESLTTHPTLHLYQEGLPCQVYCNTSTFSITGILKQVYPDGKTYTVQHFSRSLRSHERNYSDLELQCLAIVESVDNFRTCLMGRKFTIFSDHPALQWLKEIKAPSGRLFRWRLRLSRYEYEVRSINGVQQYETGVGTRIPFCGFLDAPLIQSQQSSPPGKSRVTMDHNKLRTVSRKGVLKTIVPSSLTTRLLKSVHTQHHHPNISKMTRLISSQYYWQNMTQDIAKQVKTCPTCRFARRIDEYNQPSRKNTDTGPKAKQNSYIKHSVHTTQTMPKLHHPRQRNGHTAQPKSITADISLIKPLTIKQEDYEPTNHLNSTINKDQANISKSPFTKIRENMGQYPIFHLIFILCLLVLPYICIPILFINYLFIYTMPAHKIFELQEAVFNVGQTFIKLLVILGTFFAENLNKLRRDRSN